MGLLLGTDLAELMSKINLQLTSDLPAGRFITAFAGHPGRGTDHKIHYISGGQAPLIHYRARSTGWIGWRLRHCRWGFWSGRLDCPPRLRCAREISLRCSVTASSNMPDRTGEPFGKERVGGLSGLTVTIRSKSLRRNLCEAVRALRRRTIRREMT